MQTSALRTEPQISPEPNGGLASSTVRGAQHPSHERLHPSAAGDLVPFPQRHQPSPRAALFASPDYWSKQINALWLQRNQQFFELCRVTAEAKCHLHHGDWSRLFRSHAMPFSKREAEMRLRIWNAMGQLDAQDLAHLPKALTTLDVLAALDLSAIRRCIAEGLIHARMKRTEAETLVAKLTGRPLPLKQPNLLRRLQNLHECIIAALPTLTPPERNALVSALDEALLTLRTAPSQALCPSLEPSLSRPVAHASRCH